jgi:hypothetical protein
MGIREDLGVAIVTPRKTQPTVRVLAIFVIPVGILMWLSGLSSDFVATQPRFWLTLALGGMVVETMWERRHYTALILLVAGIGAGYSATVPARLALDLVIAAVFTLGLFFWVHPHWGWIVDHLPEAQEYGEDR